MKTEFKIIIQKLNSMDSKIDRLDARVERLEADVAELKTDIAELKADVAELKNNVSNLQKCMSSVERSICRIDMTFENYIYNIIKAAEEWHLDSFRSLHVAEQVKDEKDYSIFYR